MKPKVQSDVYTQRFNVDGMSCAACVNAVEKTLGRVDGIEAVTVNLANKSADIKHNPNTVQLSEIANALTEIGFPAEPVNEDSAPTDLVERHFADYKSNRNKFIFAGLASIVVMLLSMTDLVDVKFARLLSFLITSAVIFFPGRHFFTSAFKLAIRRTSDMNTLIAIGTGSAFIFSLIGTFIPAAIPSSMELPPVFYDTAVMIIALILLGRTFEARAKSSASNAISGLMKLSPKTAMVVRNGETIETPTDQLKVDNIIRVRAGERIPTDGELSDGSSSIDESMLTGESIPVMKIKGDHLYGGTLNGSGSFLMKATRIGSETALAGIIKLVEQAQGSKAPIQRLADKVASVFVPVVLGIAAITLVIWLIAGPDPILSHALTAFVSVLIIACPCAMGLATPTAIMVGSGTAARHGVVFKGADILESAGNIQTLLLDKTGTVTTGKASVTTISPISGVTDSELLTIAAAIETGSDHPLATAVNRAAKERELEIPSADNFNSIPGHGMEAVVEGETIKVGSFEWMQESGVNVNEQNLSDINNRQERGESVITIARNSELIGWLGVTDTPRETSVSAIKALKAIGLEIVLLSGDRKKVADQIGNEVGVDKVIAEVLPSGKVQEVKNLQFQNRSVGMVGDGINDAPALAQANVGFAIGTGSDIALEASDVTLVGSDLNGVTFAIRMARQTVRVIKQNLFWAFGYNSLGIPIAAGVLYPLTGELLSPMIAAAAMAFSSVSVVMNSLRLRKFK
ncbi:MAG: copper-translocating P-type ATPase [Calditrichaeota bacterium]|nr:copper-translocating P-type ATPase [Calditrichota bacterium]